MTSTRSPTNGVNRKALIQWCMSSQLFSEALFTEAITRIYKEEAGEAEAAEAAARTLLAAEVEEINTALSPLSLQLRSCMDQQTGARLWALVNVTADKPFASATPYSAAELGVLKALVELVFTSADGNYAVDLHTAIRAACSTTAAGTPLLATKKEAQEFLNRVNRDGWLGSGPHGECVIGSRALIELQSYLTDGFGDYARFCSLCNEMATCGSVCAQCDQSVHPFCADQILKSVGRLSCPKCHQSMADALKFGPGEDGVPHNIIDVSATQQEAQEDGSVDLSDDS
ncbi:hypothetical protein LPJ72_005125 [Coemansia sp. Benny D160-2]|nr:hypothetical protein LPJ72_005125 [Coemansia sp. Benny D160-2]